MGKPGDIRLSFNEAVEIYDTVRPSYPAPVFDALFEMLPSSPRIVEVGPGTGQATRDLLRAVRAGSRRTARPTSRSSRPADAGGVASGFAFSICLGSPLRLEPDLQRPRNTDY